MKPATTKSKNSENDLGPQSNQSPYASNKNSHALKVSRETAFDRDEPRSSNTSTNNSGAYVRIQNGREKFDNSKMRNNGSPIKSDKTKDAKDPFMFPVERRFVVNDNSAEYVYEYEYESPIEDKNKKSLPANNTKTQSKNKNSPKKQITKKNSPRSQLSPRKREITQKIKKLEAELKDLQSSVISGITNENSESVNELTHKINVQRKKLNELERLAELEKLEQKEQNDNKELLRRIEILEKNQEVILSPKPRPNLGFMSPNDAIVSIKAQPFSQDEEGSSLIERRKQTPLNVDVPKKQSNSDSTKKQEQQVQEREIALSSSEKKLNESSFCQMNPIDAKEFADKHLKDIIIANPKQYSSHTNSKSKNSITSFDESLKESQKNHKQPKQSASQYRSGNQNEPTSHSQRHSKAQKDQNKAPEQETKFRSNRSNKNPKESSKPQRNIQDPIRHQRREERPTVTTRSIDLDAPNYNQGDENLSVDVTIADVLKIPDVSAYCVIYTETTNRSPFKTKVSKRGTETTIFNENFQFSFDLSNPKSSVLVVLIKKEDLIRGDKLIGSVKINLCAVVRSMNRKRVNKLDKAFPIISDSKIQTEGRLHLIFRSDSVLPTNYKYNTEKKSKKEPKKAERPTRPKQKETQPETKNRRNSSEIKNNETPSEIRNSRNSSEIKDSRNSSEIRNSRNSSEIKNSHNSSEIKNSRNSSEIKNSQNSSEIRNSRNSSEIKNNETPSEIRNEEEENKPQSLQKEPSISSNNADKANTNERNIKLESEPSEKQKEQPKVQPNLKSSIVSLLSDHSSKASSTKNQKAPKQSDKTPKAQKPQEREEPPKENTTPKPKKEIENATKSPKSPKYNWNTGSLIKKNKKKPIYEIVSEDEEQVQQEESDPYDENAPTLNPTSFPIPDIKFTPSIEGELEREADERDRLNNFTLQDILEQTGSPVRARDVEFDFDNETFSEEEEEYDDFTQIKDDLPLETVSEDEDQITNKLDKQFGKEPPRLSSANQSDIDFNFNDSNDAVTYNLANISKYYQPRFINDDLAKRRDERKRRQKFKEKQQYDERAANLSENSQSDEENAEEIDIQIDYTTKKRPRITKVNNNNESIEADINSENDEQIGMLPVNDDESESEGKQKERDIKDNNQQQMEEEEISDDDKDNILDVSSNSEKSENGKQLSDDDDEEEDKDKNDKSTSSIGKLELDCFTSNDENNRAPQKRSVNERFDQIEKVESSNSPQINKLSESSGPIFNYSNSNKNTKLSTSDAQATIPVNKSSSLISLSATSSFSESSIKSSFDQFKFLESVKNLANQNKDIDASD